MKQIQIVSRETQLVSCFKCLRLAQTIHPRRRDLVRCTRISSVSTYLGKYSLPRESEIRTAISTLYSKQKAGAAAAASSAEGTEDVGDLAKRGRKSPLPPIMLEFIDAQIGAGKTTSAVLQQVRQEFGGEIRAVGQEQNFVTDAQIKNRCNNAKNSNKTKQLVT